MTCCHEINSHKINCHHIKSHFDMLWYLDNPLKAVLSLSHRGHPYLMPDLGGWSCSVHMTSTASPPDVAFPFHPALWNLNLKTLYLKFLKIWGMLLVLIRVNKIEAISSRSKNFVKCTLFQKLSWFVTNWSCESWSRSKLISWEFIWWQLISWESISWKEAS